jgi:hypothetical protein
MHFDMRKLFLFFILLLQVSSVSAAPAYGTKMPQKKQFFTGLQNHTLLKRYLEDNYGKVRSSQNFLLVSYGIFDWLSVDLKGGAGDIKQHPLGVAEVDYSTGFSGGYGFRLRLLNKEKTKVVFGFQHISVHPKRTYVAGVKNKAILDDWQVSMLASYDLKYLTPYLGTRWSRVDYIHWVDEVRKRKMSDLSRSVGLIFGFDVPFTEKMWLNLEGQFFDSDAFACSLNYSF